MTALLATVLVVGVIAAPAFVLGRWTATDRRRPRGRPAPIPSSHRRHLRPGEVIREARLGISERPRTGFGIVPAGVAEQGSTDFPGQSRGRGDTITLADDEPGYSVRVEP